MRPNAPPLQNKKQPVKTVLAKESPGHPSQCFTRVAGLQGDRCAIIEDSDHHDYRSLLLMVEQRHRTLMARGVTDGDFVVIYGPRGADMVAAMLAVLTTGAAFCLIDPALPEERQREMLAQLVPAVLLSDTDRRESLVALGADPERICHPAADLDLPLLCETREPRPDAPAYAFFTSGSTGKPKAAIVTYAGLANHMAAKIADLEIDAGDCVLQNASSSFDIVVWQCLATLTVGGCLRIVDNLTAVDPRATVDLLTQEHVTVMEVVPSFLSLLVEEIQSHASLPTFAGLKFVFSNAERLPPWLCRQWLDLYPEIPLYNSWGATECSDDVTHYRIDRPPEEGAGEIPVGYPIANVTVYSLDDAGQMVEAGEPGHLHVAGVAVGAGYLGDPKLTQDRFLPDPFSDLPGARMYKTGDIGRIQPDGLVEFIGRRDHQIKIRGYRVELGEVEAALSEHVNVRECAVCAPLVGSAHSLVAFVVPAYESSTEPLDSSDAEGHSEYLQQWNEIWEENYREEAHQKAPTFNTTGWNSSFTGAPYPQDLVADWVNQTVERLRDLAPKSVLEIGCGSGLLLHRLAPETDTYVGIDFSEQVIGQLRSAVETRRLDGVELFACEATDLDALQEQRFDLVIINSVIQYFPNLTYLGHVLEGALAHCRPGGTVFVGDVRDKRLLKAFHASVLHAKGMDPKASGFKSLVETQVDREKELLVHPAYFKRFADRHPDPMTATILSKRGDERTEMTVFRFDVLLSKSEKCFAPGGYLPWVEPPFPFDIIAARLRKDAAPFAITDVPDGRLGLITRAAGPVTELPTDIFSDEAPDPETFWRLGDDFGRRCLISPASTSGLLDIIYTSQDCWPTWPIGKQSLAVADSELSNAPDRQHSNLRLEELREFLRRRLPDYMVPSAFLLRTDLPRLSSGKLDRKELVRTWAPDSSAKSGKTAQSDSEMIVARLWQEALDLPTVAREMNFFDLGGHSLMAASVVGQIRRIFGIDLPIRAHFDNPTVAKLASQIDRLMAEQPVAAKSAGISTGGLSG